MHVDLDTAPAGAAYRSTYCIVGAGISGLLLARKLAAGGATVHLLEAGGLEPEERSQSLYAAEMPRETHTGTTEGRFRTLGGSSTRWGGQLLPYTPDIFTPPPGSAAPAWRITERDLERFYPEIEQLMHTGTLPFDDRMLAARGQVRPDFSAGLRVRFSKWAPFRRRNLAHTVAPECLAHPQITLFTHANVAELHGAAGRIEQARVLNYAGQEFGFAADTFIVAAGVVESARLLLSSSAVPNPHDQLGRYFHDHVSFHAATVPAAARAKVFEKLGPFFIGGVLHTPKLEATPELQAEHGLLAAMAHIVIEEPEDGGMAAVRQLLTAVQRRTRVTPAILLAVLRGAGDVLRLAWSTKVRKRRAVSRRAQVWFNIDMEQPPRAGQRIRLSGTRDALGLPKAAVEWSIGEQEGATALRFARVMEVEWARAGFGPLAWSADVLAGRTPRLADTYHAMGGLRMGTDPRTSVVDANLRVHGMENLYIASCAVYPTGGSSNPTFTLMALTLRLAEHLLGKT